MNDRLKPHCELPPEQQAIRDKCFHPSGTFVEFPKEEIEQSIVGRFEKIVRQYPNRLAVKDGDRSLTYEDLNISANKIAHRILGRYGEGNRPVAILMDHGADVLAAILGVLKVGKIYVPLDPTYPAERLIYLLTDAKPEIVITENESYALAYEVVGHSERIMKLDDFEADASVGDPDFSVAPNALAYIIYTSGSTGEPKGVVENHRNLLHGTLRFTNGLHICREDRLSLTHSCSTSASVRWIFPALLNGAALFPFSVKRYGVTALLRMVEDEAITILSTGRIRDLLLHVTPVQTFPHLRLVSFGGEVIHRSDVDLYRQLFPRQCLIGIWMSCTETGNIAQFLIDDARALRSDVLPIGYPADDVEIMVLNDSGVAVGAGEVGELVVRSKYLSPGYWNRPDLTDERFKSDADRENARLYFTGDLARRDADGCLFHLGRKDNQVKISGYRVETVEVEAALAGMGHFNRVCVTVKDSAASGKQLIAYLVPKRRPVPTASSLRRALAQRLAPHMIPSRFVTLDSLPLTPTGKLDRKALPDPGNTRPVLDAPFVALSSNEERIIAKIWSEILGVDPIGLFDNFFDLGGHSFSASRVIARLAQTFQVELPISSLFNAPTVAEMAVLLMRCRWNEMTAEEI
jgi:amino acid adenylation domain-containing protein